MVFIAPFIGAVTLFAGFASALPRPDSAEGSEVAVSAPNGIILSDTAELASQLSSESAASATASSFSASTTEYPASATDFSSSSSLSYATSTSSSYVSIETSSYNTYDSSYNTYDGSSSSSSAYYATSTSSAYSSTVTYGSGSTGWGGMGYDDCVNQCIASFGAPPPAWTPPPPTATYTGSGTVHTIIVAPTPGVLRYLPPFVNAQPGDMIHFVWNANDHTVTKSSQLQMCNKTGDAPFTSGIQNISATFDQMVNDTNPVFFYCGVPNHCEKGMFGTINPGGVDGSNGTTVDDAMPSMVSNSSSLSAMASYLNNLNGSAAAMSWGGKVDISSFPEWSHPYVMENVMYARTLFAMNPDTISADGKVDMSAGGNPIKFPEDIAATLRINNAAQSDSSSSSSSAAPSSSTAAPSSTASDSVSSSSASGTSSSAMPTQTNGAGHVAASGALIGAVAIVASLLAL